MSVRNRSVHFLGLMTVLTLLLCVSVMSCCPCQKKEAIISCYCPDNPHRECPGGGVTGAVREDVDGDGYEVSEPPISGPSMRLLIGTTPYLGPVNRTSGGGYSFLAPPGNYNVEASASGYVTQTKPVTIPSSGNATKNFGLRRP